MGMENRKNKEQKKMRNKGEGGQRRREILLVFVLLIYSRIFLAVIINC